MRPGVVLQGQYRLVSPLGEGGMGAVWRAEDLSLGAPVAIKLMHPRDAASPETRARFEAEARTAARLRSPHVVQVLGAGVDTESGAPFIVMELLEGETLRDRLLRTGSLAPLESAKVITHVARALTRAHEQHVIHRDLKPTNIFLVQNADAELAKVLDFGIAKRSSHTSPHGPTVTGELLGTPSYMSPEQILSSKDVDHRTDLWSLAVIAVECLTGRLPFDSDNLPGLALLICQGQSTLPSRLGRVPSGFDDWFLRATDLDPTRRFASAAQLAEELRLLCASSDSVDACGAEPFAAEPPRANASALTAETQRPDPPPPPSVGPLSSTLVRRWLSARRWPESRGWLGAAVVGVLVLFGAGWALLSRASRLPSPTQTANAEPARSAELAVAARPDPIEAASAELRPAPPPRVPGATNETPAPAEHAESSTLKPKIRADAPLHAHANSSGSRAAGGARTAVRPKLVTARRAEARRAGAASESNAALTPRDSALVQRLEKDEQGSRVPAAPSAAADGASRRTTLDGPLPAVALPAREPVPSVPVAAPASPSTAYETLSPEAGRSLLAINPQVKPFRVVVPPEYVAGGNQYVSLIRICVSSKGMVSSVSILKPSLPVLDRRIPETVTRWHYWPFFKEGRAVPFCYSTNYRVE